MRCPRIQPCFTAWVICRKIPKYSRVLILCVIYEYDSYFEHDGRNQFMLNSIISDTSAAIKLIAALYEAGVIDAQTYHSVLTKYAPAA